VVNGAGPAVQQHRTIKLPTRSCPNPSKVTRELPAMVTV
jgi:hypothetical protein